VKDCISLLTEDIDPDATHNVEQFDSAVNRCVKAVTDSLLKPSAQLTDDRRGHLSQIFFSMRHAHRAVRKLLERDGQDPMATNVMPLVRTQLETLFALCLVLEKPAALDLYLKDGWKKLYIRHLIAREERKGPRTIADLQKQAVQIEEFRLASGVTPIEKQTIDERELGITLPPGVRPEKIGKFPLPGTVVRDVLDPDRKKMLQRLYPEYQFLCGFVHFSPAATILSTLLDSRQPPYQWSTSGQKYEIFQSEIAGPALNLGLISIVQSCCEFVSVYPGDIELARATVGAWKQLTDTSLLGKVIWQLRARKLLGVLS
jgi:hypothetical protein